MEMELLELIVSAFEIDETAGPFVPLFNRVAVVEDVDIGCASRSYRFRPLR